MLLRDLVLRRGCCWPSLLLHCALHPLWGFVQVSGGAGCAPRTTSWAGQGSEGLSLHSHDPGFLRLPVRLVPGKSLGREKMLWLPVLWPWKDKKLLKETSVLAC